MRAVGLALLLCCIGGLGWDSVAMLKEKFFGKKEKRAPWVAVSKA